MQKRSVDYVGTRYGKLTITEYLGIHRFAGGGGANIFRFQCDCGNAFDAQKSNVAGKRTHCGCLAPGKKWTMPHGGWKHPLYKTWAHMIDRCTNKHCVDFKNYGGRGISVCERWTFGNGATTGLECFVSDMGDRPVGHTIERVDGNGNYEPGNCIWLPKADQARNRRGVKLVRMNGQVKTIPQWCAETGVPYFTAIRRVRRGWPPDKAVTQIVRKAAK